MGKVLFKGKKNNSGSTIVIVLLMTSFVLILSTLITTTTMINLRMKMASSQSTKSFYTAEQAVDEVRAALGVISVECFNTAYEEELTKLYSTNSTGTTINNKEANQQMRQKYTKDLLNKMQLFEGVPSSDAKIAFYLGQPAGSFTIANWNADDTKADEKKIYTSFVDTLNNYIEDNTKLSVEKVTKITFDVSGVSPLYSYAIGFYDCVVKYLDNSGNYSYITFNGAVGMPDIEIDFKNDDKVGTLCFADYSLVGNGGIILPKNASATISGSAYAGTGASAKGTALTINDGASLTMGGGYFVCGGNIEADNNSGLSVNNTSLWAKNINVSDGVTINSNAASFNLQDDLTVDGENSEVNINGSFFGFGYEEGNLAKQRPNYSSAIIVNGLNSHITFGTLGQLYVAGRAYIKFSDDRAYATGESSAVNINQEIYMIPAKLLTNGSKNPSALNDSAASGVKFTCDINENNFFAYDLLADEKYESRNAYFDTDGNLVDESTLETDSTTHLITDANIRANSKTYYYFKFKDDYARNKYANLILDDTEFESYISGKSDDYKENARKLRKQIIAAKDSFKGLTNSSITGVSINTPGAFSQITSSSGSTLSAAELKIKAASTDRALRYDVLNKILANPLKSDEESGWYTSRADLQNDLSSRNPAKYSSINLSNYTLGDVFGNIINEEGIEELLRSGAGPTYSYPRFTDGSHYAVYKLNSADPTETLKISTVGFASGLVVCTGNVDVDVDFSGVILAKGKVTVESGCTVSNGYTETSFKTAMEGWMNSANEADGTLRNGYDIGHIFRFYNSKTTTTSGTLTVDKMTYRDMVRVDKWRKYEEEEAYSTATTE
ncbi:hypothetical protein LK414_10265 [Lachnospira eligens]|uniref:Uncharacterized protein n=1 Tax=Lachnospira eligens (strain ATCC 27750 / DSM 3376 / VPI C15-48 / C15-B4) TaxID=515620 RepID=C4Z5E5_LACE2|nr:hypothetical protein [Lachnospira eligens]ACR71804.1 Hypothetical protein EUBELI_00796 [[Eubacterium] eligens ATCC 27750]UEA97235.1 hypothetical protein LK414_10265 [Lachnospira eligens]